MTANVAISDQYQQYLIFFSKKFLRILLKTKYPKFINFLVRKNVEKKAKNIVNQSATCQLQLQEK